VTTSTLLCALLAAGLAVALSREHRIRRAFQELASRLLEKLRGAANHQTGTHTGPHSHSPRRRR
jgi:predicted component of type VI protein secretion system